MEYCKFIAWREAKTENKRKLEQQAKSELDDKPKKALTVKIGFGLSMRVVNLTLLGGRIVVQGSSTTEAKGARGIIGSDWRSRMLSARPDPQPDKRQYDYHIQGLDPEDWPIVFVFLRAERAIPCSCKARSSVLTPVDSSGETPCNSAFAGAPADPRVWI